jgi:hypothetical protein
MSLAAADNRTAKRPPTFRTEVETWAEVDIEPSELEAAGWVYVGKKDGKDAPTSEQVIDTVIRWHDDNHADPWRWCQHDLCGQLRGREQ